MSTVTPTILPAYEHCRRVARESGSSFYAGMRLLPPDRRAALFAIYALARRIDDVADGDLSADEKLDLLERTREELERIDESDDPVLVAVADAARRYPIPLGAFGELVDGAELDVGGAEYVTFAELEHYCRCVAGSIGRLALGVFDCSDRVAGEALADDLGLALQLGNILRDLAEDAANGRVYLPREDLERFGCEAVRRADRGACRAGGRLRGAARARPPRPRPRARAAARPPQRRLRARDDRRLRAPAGADRRRAGDRAPGPAVAAPLGEGPRAREEPCRRHDMSSPPRVVVVGGGLAGLAAALGCADAGADVTLYEARSRLGGATFSVERDGRFIDNGQHVALRCCTAYLGVPRAPRRRRPRAAAAAAARAGAARGRAARVHHAERAAGAAASRLVAAALSRCSARGERLAAVRAAAALRQARPGRPRARRAGLRRLARARTARARRAIEALWDLIALPTLNLHADEASLAPRVQVFRTGLLDSTDAADIGVSTVPLQRLHGDAAAAALERAGATGRRSATPRARRPRRTRAAARGRASTRPTRSSSPCRTRRSRGSSRRARSTRTAMEALGSSPIVNLHVHYDRRVLDEPFAAAVGSPVQWVFDRTASSGVAEGQLVAVSLSAAVAELGEPVATLRERYLPALERLLPAAREARVLDFAVTREPRATFRAAPGKPPPAAGPAYGRSRPLPRRRVDRHRLARHDGGRGAQRARRRLAPRWPTSRRAGSRRRALAGSGGTER